MWSMIKVPAELTVRVGYAAMRPWIRGYNEARVSAQKTGETSGTGQQLAARR